MDICDLKKSVNSDWYQDSKYDFFWNNYAYSMNHARNFYKETASGLIIFSVVCAFYSFLVKILFNFSF